MFLNVQHITIIYGEQASIYIIQKYIQKRLVLIQNNRYTLSKLANLLALKREKIII